MSFSPENSTFSKLRAFRTPEPQHLWPEHSEEEAGRGSRLLLASGCALPQHKDLGSEGRTSLESSEHQLNTETLGSVGSDTGEFLINWIIIEDLEKKKKRRFEYL